jgi:hypothetical protein
MPTPTLDPSQLFGRLNDLYALEQAVRQLVKDITPNSGDSAVETFPFQILNILLGMDALLTDSVVGLAAIQAQLATFQATTAVDITAILTAIGTPTQTGVPVDITSTASLNTAADVWSYNMGGGGTFYTVDALRAAGVAGRFLAMGTQLPYQYNIFFGFGWDATLISNPNTLNVWPLVTQGDIAATDTLATWLAKDTSGLVWARDSNEGNRYFASDSSDNGEWWCLLDDEAFISLRNFLFGSPSTTGPLWPGLSGVTLGSPVALSDGLVVSGPLSGVLIAITSVPNPISFYPFGTIKSFVRAGALVFTTDNGDSEFPSPFGPQNELILPKTMLSAASCTVRLPSGVVGTITPFTVP